MAFLASSSCILHFVDSVAFIAHALDDFQDLAPGGELAAGFALVVVHGAHEFDFVVGIIAFAGRRVDLPAAFDFASGSDATFLIGTNRPAGPVAAVGNTAPRNSATIGHKCFSSLVELGHGDFLA